jgi:hypothetical protein
MNENPRSTLSPQPQGSPQKEGGRQFGLALLSGLIVVLILGGGFYLWSRGGANHPIGPAPLPMGAEQQAYAPQIHYSDFQLSRATNMLKTEITYVDGMISNTGNRSVVEIEILLEFHDLSGKIMFHDTRRLYGKAATPLAAGERRDFELAFENVPDGWDQRPPAITVTGLQLQ